ncbi:MAG: hypothetical protein HY511_08950 [Actinobacteria bacterium]|nr:hypothetical protein [Actinomycetota bacterium]
MASTSGTRTTNCSRFTGKAMGRGAQRRIERISGWLKTIGLLRKTRHRRRRRVGWLFTGLAAHEPQRPRGPVDK